MKPTITIIVICCDEELLINVVEYSIFAFEQT